MKVLQGLCKPLFLSTLASEDCWSLLAKHAFGPYNCRNRSNLEFIGKEIVKKCDGLPIAAVALGGLLRAELSENRWNKVLKSNIWDLPNVKVLPALLLSYHHLPSPLKKCFTYCSIFPKNFILEKQMVVQLWIAEGFVHQSKSGKTMEEVADEYFDELVLRSLIHRWSVNDCVHYKMHDLINDLATMVSSSYCIRYGDRKLQESVERVRHLSYNKGKYDSFNKFDSLYESKSLRTFISLPSMIISLALHAILIIEKTIGKRRLHAKYNLIGSPIHTTYSNHETEKINIKKSG